MAEGLLSLLRPANLALSFLLELAMLAAYFYWGWQTGETTIARVGLGIGLPLLAAIIWGILMAPSSGSRLRGASYLALKLVLFGLAVVALFSARQPQLGIALAGLIAVNVVLTYVWEQ